MPTQHTNLTMHREGPNVWERQARQDSQYRATAAIGFLMIAGGTCLVAHAYKARLSSAVKMRSVKRLPKRAIDCAIRSTSAISMPLPTIMPSPYSTPISGPGYREWRATINREYILFL